MGCTSSQPKKSDSRSSACQPRDEPSQDIQSVENVNAFQYLVHDDYSISSDEENGEFEDGDGRVYCSASGSNSNGGGCMSPSYSSGNGDDKDGEILSPSSGGYHGEDKLVMSIPQFDELDQKNIKIINSIFYRYHYRSGQIVITPATSKIDDANVADGGGVDNIGGHVVNSNQPPTPTFMASQNEPFNGLHVLVKGTVALYVHTPVPYTEDLALPFITDQSLSYMNQCKLCRSMIRDEQVVTSNTSAAPQDVILEEGDNHDDDVGARREDVSKVSSSPSNSSRGYTNNVALNAALPHSPSCHSFICYYYAGEVFTTEPFSSEGMHSVCIATESSVVLSAPFSALSKNLADHPQLKLALSAPLMANSVPLQSLPYFSDLPQHKLSLIARLFTVHKVSSNKIIFKEGKKSNALYFLLNGRCEATVTGADGPVFLYLIRNDSWFGETALVGIERDMSTSSKPIPRPVTITTISDCTLQSIHRRKLKRLQQIAPEQLQQDPGSPVSSNSASPGGGFSKLVNTRATSMLKDVPQFAQLQKKSYGPQAVYDEHRLSQLTDLFQWVHVGHGERVSSGVTVPVTTNKKPVSKHFDPSFFIIVRGRANEHIQRQFTMSEPDANPADIVVQAKHKGQVLGEHILLSDKPVCGVVIDADEKEDLLMLRLPSQAFLQFSQVCPDICTNLRYALETYSTRRSSLALQKSEFIKNTVVENRAWSKLDSLSTLFTVVNLPAGQFLFENGQTPEHAVYLITSGSVEILVDGSVSEIISVDDVVSCIDHPALFSVRTKDDVALLALNNIKSLESVAPEQSAEIIAKGRLRYQSILSTLPLFQTIEENRSWSKGEILASLFTAVAMPVGPCDLSKFKLGVILHGELLLTFENGANVTLSTGDLVNEHVCIASKLLQRKRKTCEPITIETKFKTEIVSPVIMFVLHSSSEVDKAFGVASELVNVILYSLGIKLNNTDDKIISLLRRKCNAQVYSQEHVLELTNMYTDYTGDFIDICEVLYPDVLNARKQWSDVMEANCRRKSLTIQNGAIIAVPKELKLEDTGQAEDTSSSNKIEDTSKTTEPINSTVDEEIQATEQTTVVDPAPIEDPVPIEEAAPIEDPASSEEAAPIEDPAPIEEAAPIEDPTPIEDPAPAPVEEATPVQEASPVGETVPIQEVASIDETDPVQDSTVEATTATNTNSTKKNKKGKGKGKQ